MKPITENENVAMAVLTVVLTPCVKFNRATVPWSKIYDGLSQTDLNWLKSGVSALLELNMLGREGVEIGVTDGGKAYMAFWQQLSSATDTSKADKEPSPRLDALRLAINKDARLSPPVFRKNPTVDQVLPPTASTSMWSFWTIAFLIFMIFCLGNFIRVAAR